MRKLALATALVALVFGGLVLVYTALQARPPAPAAKEAGAQMAPTPAGGMGAMAPSPPAGGMAGMTPGGPTVPPVKGFIEGQEMRFIHTEASDPKVADMLTKMMNSPVLVVPSLAQAPQTMLANVYVFTNGIKGDGPFGFQPDVFDNPPGTPAYSPLRAVNLVTWKNEQTARELKSLAEVKDTEAKGEITIERPGAVVNMPFLIWPGGQR